MTVAYHFLKYLRAGLSLCGSATIWGACLVGTILVDVFGPES